MGQPNQCRQCDSVNRAGRRFCSACGAALSPLCPSCGGTNEIGDRFCGDCGAALEVSPVTTAAVVGTPETAPADFGERRQVAVLFADLSGYTSLAAQRDPEDTHRILGRFFQVVDTAVTRFGGTVERHIGDNVMGVFGAPVAHGDDPHRAAKAAADIHRVVKALGEELGVGLAVHVGIAAGTVMASQTGSTLKAAYGVVGSPVNLAARLQGLAKPGETLIAHAIRESVASLFDVEAVGEVSIKGLDAPVQVWRVLGERLEPDTGAGAPLIGRRAEIELLRSLLDAVAASNSAEPSTSGGKPASARPASCGPLPTWRASAASPATPPWYWISARDRAATLLACS